jgi:ATP-dependent DNA helicase RecQ
MSTSVQRTAAAGMDRFHEALRRYWGYTSFRAGQEQIVQSIAAGRDACVVMPTGGGKSLCYQLPAALAEGRTAVVISPLIALMQDQVAHLTQMGIPAVFLNSAVAAAERSELKRRVAAGEFRLLYLSPERIALEESAEWLRGVAVSFFAIDEAHCISEWGHDFRPEYRQLSRLRELFPERPIAAFTASATQRVRHDIVEQLRLRDPFKYISSFRRANLRYAVRECDGLTQRELLLRAARNAAQGSVIVYASTIARVGEVADFLAENGIAAVGYHGQMDTAARRQNQEKWMADEVRVMVGTMAFGLGINKAAVRAVIHLALPKSVEQFYQEAGRAGRDGLPADCFLFWQKRDSGLHTYFIQQIADEAERKRAWQRFDEVRDFVQSRECRQTLICRHFGERLKEQRCGNCDACAGLPDWMSVAPKATGKRRKKSSVVPSSDKQSALGAGAGSGIGGWGGAAKLSGEDAELENYLREWRRNVARDSGTPAFVVMHDTTLESIARSKPASRAELARVPGIGEKKLEQYGDAILTALRRFAKGERAQRNWQASAADPAAETLGLLEAGRTFEEIAQIRGRTLGTVLERVAALVEAGQTEFRESWFAREKLALIRDACGRLGMERLKPIKEALPQEITYGEIRLVAAHLRASGSGATPGERDAR